MFSDREKALNALKILGEVDLKCLQEITEELLQKERAGKTKNLPEVKPENEMKVKTDLTTDLPLKTSDGSNEQKVESTEAEKPKTNDANPIVEGDKPATNDKDSETKENEPEIKDEKPEVIVEIETKAFNKLPVRDSSELDEKKNGSDDDDENKLKLIVPEATFGPLRAKITDNIMWSIPFSWQMVDFLSRKGWNVEDCTYVCLGETKNITLYSAITKAAVNDTVGCSLEVSVKRENTNRYYSWRPQDDGKKKKKNKCELSLGLGLHELTYTPENGNGKSETVVVLHSNVGEPQVDNCGMVVTERFLLLFVKGKNRPMFFKQFLTYVHEKSQEKHELLITIYRWFCRRSYWRKVGKKLPRSMKSVVLPPKTKKLVDQDIRSFLSKGTEKFYNKHGIPYKRSYLFRGVPGSGKTSFIEALAGVHKRNLCQLMLSVPLMTDEMFANCISNIPLDSIVVLEDVDSLFDSGRKKENKDCPLTFSAILNGLDGIASPYAQIIIMTTNYPNRLDPALVRSGRVDVHIEFKNANRMQMEGIFLNFYPESGDLAKEFSEKLSKLSKGTLSMATIQQHFVRHMCDDAKETIAALEEIMEFAFMESQSCASKPGSVYN